MNSTDGDARREAGAEAGGVFAPSVAVLGEAERSQLYDKISQLEKDLESERESAREHVFLWQTAVAVPTLIVAFTAIQNPVGSFLIFLLVVVLLLCSAKRLGVDWAVRLFGLLVHLLVKRWPGLQAL